MPKPPTPSNMNEEELITYIFELDKNGKKMLPTWIRQKNKQRLFKKNIMAKFMNLMNRKCTPPLVLKPKFSTKWICT